MRPIVLLLLGACASEPTPLSQADLRGGFDIDGDGTPDLVEKTENLSLDVEPPIHTSRVWWQPEAGAQHAFLEPGRALDDVDWLDWELQIASSSRGEEVPTRETVTFERPTLVGFRLGAVQAWAELVHEDGRVVLLDGVRQRDASPLTCCQGLQK
jgi:hypothetical protein